MVSLKLGFPRTSPNAFCWRQMQRSLPDKDLLLWLDGRGRGRRTWAEHTFVCMRMHFDMNHSPRHQVNTLQIFISIFLFATCSLIRFSTCKHAAKAGNPTWDVLGSSDQCSFVFRFLWHLRLEGVVLKVLPFSCHVAHELWSKMGWDWTFCTVPAHLVQK